jgi:hypothetical protein
MPCIALECSGLFHVTSDKLGDKDNPVQNNHCDNPPADFRGVVVIMIVSMFPGISTFVQMQHKFFTLRWIKHMNMLVNQQWIVVLRVSRTCHETKCGDLGSLVSMMAFWDDVI